MEIPKKDIEIIRGVADHLVRRRFVPGMTEEDLRQELFIVGMESYSKWNEETHSHKSVAKRDSNLRLFLKRFMGFRIENMIRSSNTNSQKANINVISFDTTDPMYESVFTYNEEDGIDRSQFDGLGVTEDQIDVLMYIAQNGLGNIRQKNEPSRKNVAESLGITEDQVRSILSNLRGNVKLRKFLIEGVRTA